MKFEINVKYEMTQNNFFKTNSIQLNYTRFFVFLSKIHCSITD